MRFRLIPREEKFYADFIALADELRVGARLLEEMLAADTPRLGQGGRDQGGRAPVRLPDPRDHPAPEPHVRHAARPRGHPRARAVARRRHGRHRRVGGRHPALPHRPTCGTARASWRGSSPALAEQVRNGARRARADEAASTSSAVEINRLENEADRDPRGGACAACSTRRRDPIAVIKWKEMLDLLEDATDRCEDVANVLEGVVVKHG